MQILFRALLSLAVLIIYIRLGKKAAGSLKLSRLNLISVSFYYMLLENLAGGTLIYVGLREHYLVQKIANPEVIDKTYYIIAYTLIMFCVTVIAVNKIFSRRSPEYNFEKFIHKPVLCRKDMTGAQAGTILMMMVCFGATGYVFAKLGYIPITRMVTSSSYAIAVMRQGANKNFTGNQYIKNILMNNLTPFISYYAYIWYRATGSRTWRQIWIVLLVLSILVVTYDFSKAPLVFYLISYYLINIFMGFVNDNRQFVKFSVAAVLIIIFFYAFMLHADLDLNIYGGPVGRVLFTQIATLFLHVETFPARHPYLMGASFYKWFAPIIPNATMRRSARVVMETFNPAGVAEDTAGVMNTLFVGEAYANFGIAGVIVAPIIFGVIIGVASNVLRSSRKTPEIVLLYLFFTNSFSHMIEGGFIDIFYNASYILVPLYIFWLVISSNSHYSVPKYSTKKGSALA